MSANVGTGRVRRVRYCGADYTVSPGEQHGNKQVWEVYRGETRVARFATTRSKALAKIHEDAVERGAYPSQQADGLTYQGLVAAICR